MTALEIFRMIASEFASMTDEDVQKWLDLAAEFIDQETFGDKYDSAVAYYAAHLIKVESGNGTAGAIEEKKVGDLRIKYHQGNEALMGFNTTSYGQQYLVIQKGCVVPIVGLC